MAVSHLDSCRGRADQARPGRGHPGGRDLRWHDAHPARPHLDAGRGGGRRRGPGAGIAPPAVVVIGDVVRLGGGGGGGGGGESLGARSVSGPALLAVAHGSRNPAAADVVGRMVGRQIARLAPVLDVRVAFLGHAEPSLPAPAGRGRARRGHRAAAAVVRLPHLGRYRRGCANLAGARVAAALGPDQLLLTALTARLAEAGVPDGTPLVLAAAGSSDPAAMTDVGQRADSRGPTWTCRSRPAYLSAAQPARRGCGARPGREPGRATVAVASYLLAPGQFQDQLAGSGAAWVTAPLGGHPALAGIVIDRYRTAVKSR